MAELKQPFNPPIFIHGIVKRSGTNYLRDLLCLHPDCYFGGPIWEHELLEHAELLQLYSRFTYHRWPAKWHVEEKIGPPARLMAALGQGLEQFLNLQLLGPTHYDPTHLPLSPTLRLVTKSPSVENLPAFFELFPQAKLLLIIRDGRAVIESTMRSFQKGFEPSLHEWHYAANIILKTLRHIPAERYRLVRYEELYHNTEAELTAIMDFVGLEVSRYNFEAMRNLPIRGSSELTQQGSLHWQAVEKKKSFNPLQRWQKWSAADHQRFNWVAGEAQRALGYECEAIQQTPLSMGQNLLKDTVWKPYWPIHRTLRKAKYMLGL